MKTAGFFDYWDGPGRVAISRGTPRRYPAGYDKKDFINNIGT